MLVFMVIAVDKSTTSVPSVSDDCDKRDDSTGMICSPLRRSSALRTKQNLAYMCQTAMPANNASLLLGTRAVAERLYIASRRYHLLDVTLDANDSLPQNIRRKCKPLKLLARENYRSLSSRGSLKQTRKAVELLVPLQMQ